MSAEDFDPAHVANEEWRPVPGHEGAYEVSSIGRVRSLDRVVHNSGDQHRGPYIRRFRGRTLSAVGNPYLAVDLPGRGGVRVNVLVLEAFSGPRPERHVARHLNDNPKDNRIENLAWGTRAENVQDSIRNGLNAFANKTHCIRGHEFTPGNTYLYVNPKTRHRCRTCLKCRKYRESLRGVKA